jgi:hypothetical protein
MARGIGGSRIGALSPDRVEAEQAVNANPTIPTRTNVVHFFMGKIIDRSGLRYGKLVVRKFVGLAQTKAHSALWECVCDCGGVSVVEGSKLQSGQTQSCGCIQRAAIGLRSKRHGLTNSRAYHIWSSMKRRCIAPTSKHYKWYGARGIRVCDSWLGSFEQFVSDMGLPLPDMTLDRIDNNGNYEPGNCRWVKQKSQNRNKRNTIRIVLGGEEGALAAFAERFGVPYALAYHRHRRGWSPERLFIAPTSQY